MVCSGFVDATPVEARPAFVGVAALICEALRSEPDLKLKENNLSSLTALQGWTSPGNAGNRSLSNGSFYSVGNQYHFTLL